MDNCPCKNCAAPERHIGCHATCERGIAWKRIHEEEKAKIYKARRANNETLTAMYEGMERIKKSKIRRKSRE